MKKTVTKFLLFLMLTVGITAFAKTDAKAAAPTVTGLRQTEDFDTMLDISWNPVSGNANDEISYEVRIRKAGAAAQIEDSDSSTYHTFNGLEPGTSYYASIRVNVNGSWGAYSNEIEVVTAPRYAGDIKINQTKAGKNSATFQWTAVPGANLYKVTYGPYNGQTTQYVTTNSLSVSNLKKDTNNYCSIEAVRRSAQGYTTQRIYAEGDGGIALVPNKLSYGNLYFYPEKGNVSLFMEHEHYADALEYQYYTAYKKKDAQIAKQTTGDISTSSEITKKALKYTKAPRVYKVRVRAYKTADNGTKFYTGWTNWKYFSNESKAPTLKNKKSKGIEVKWKKVTGADGYKVYASTSRNGKGKVVATIKKGSTVKTTFKKYNKKALKSKKTYYVYVIPQKKVNGKWQAVEPSRTWYRGVKYSKK